MRILKRFNAAVIHFGLFILLIVFLIMSCGGGGSGSDVNPAADTAGVWNQMNWDEKNWQ